MKKSPFENLINLADLGERVNGLSSIPTTSTPSSRFSRLLGDQMEIVQPMPSASTPLGIPTESLPTPPEENEFANSIQYDTSSLGSPMPSKQPKPLEFRPGMLTMEAPKLELDQDVMDMIARLNAKDSGNAEASAPANEVRAPANEINKDMVQKPVTPPPADKNIPTLEDSKEQEEDTSDEMSLEDKYDILKIGQKLGTSIAGYGQGLDITPDSSLIDSLQTSLAARKKAAIEKQKADSELKLNSLAASAKEAELKKTLALRDKNSPETKAYKAQIGGLFPELKNMPGFEDATAEQLQENIDFLKLKDQQNARAQQNQLQRAALQQGFSNKLTEQELQEDRKQKREVQKENREIKQKLTQAIPALEAQLKLLEDTKKQYEEYSKGFLNTGTGPVATLGGLTKVFSDTEKLDSQFKKIALNSMVSTFAGMSKAVDSNAERAAFEATQPSITTDDPTNRANLDMAIEATKSLIEKSKKASAKYDLMGAFTEEEAMALTNAPVSNQPLKTTTLQSTSQDKTTTSPAQNVPQSTSKKPGWAK